MTPGTWSAASADGAEAVGIVVAGSAGQDRLGLRGGDRLTVVVADGAGGSSGGSEAAEAMVRLVEALHVRRLSVEDMLDAVYGLDEQLAASPTAGETTAILAQIDEGRLVGVSVGDSEVWSFGRDGGRPLTNRQVRKPLLGCGRVSLVPFELELGRGQLLLGSDGLFAYAARAAIAVAVRGSGTQRERVEALAGLARLPSGVWPDDVAVALIAVDG